MTLLLVVTDIVHHEECRPLNPKWRPMEDVISQWLSRVLHTPQQDATVTRIMDATSLFQGSGLTWIIVGGTKFYKSLPLFLLSTLWKKKRKEKVNLSNSKTWACTGALLSVVDSKFLTTFQRVLSSFACSTSICLSTTLLRVSTSSSSCFVVIFFFRICLAESRVVGLEQFVSRQSPLVRIKGYRGVYLTCWLMVAFLSNSMSCLCVF